MHDKTHSNSGNLYCILKSSFKLHPFSRARYTSVYKKFKLEALAAQKVGLPPIAILNNIFCDCSRSQKRNVYMHHICAAKSICNKHTQYDSLTCLGLFLKGFSLKCNKACTSC